MEQKIWFKYIMQKLNEADVPITYRIGKNDAWMSNFPFTLFCCGAETSHMDLCARIDFKPKKLNKASTLTDLLEEKLVLGILNKDKPYEDEYQGIVIDFILNKDKARLKKINIFNRVNLPTFILEYARGVNYNAKEVVDGLLGTFLNDYKGISSNYKEVSIIR